MQGKQESANWRRHLYIVSSEYIATVTGHRGINFLNDYDEADEEGRRWLDLSCNIQMNNKNPREKANIIFNTGGSFRHYNNCGSTHPSMAASKENKLRPSFSGFKSQKCLHESSYDGVSGTDNDEQSLKNLSKCLSSLAARSVLLISKRQYTSWKRFL